MLFLHQRGGVAWLVLQRRTILGDPQGNGKTPMVIRAIQVLNLRAGSQGVPATPALIVAPGSALYNWQREFAEWAPELSVRVIDGTALRRRQAMAGEGEADVYVIAWSNVRAHSRLAAYPGIKFVRCPEHGGRSEDITAGQCEVHDKELNQIPFQLVVPDEAHRMKDPKSKQSRAVSWLMQQAPYAWAVTGTPIAENIGDLWPVEHALDPRSFPSRSKYLDLFAVQQNAWHQGRDILGIRPDTAGAYHSIVQPTMRRIPKEIARPGMPPRLPPVFRRPVMTPAQSRLYRQLAREALGELDGTTIVPANSGVRFARLCQLSASMIEMEDGEDPLGFTSPRVRLCLPSSKADDLIDFLADNPGSLVVSVNSPRVIEICERKLAAEKITHCKIAGGMTSRDKDQAQQWFQNGDCRVIMLQPRAGGEAITLTAADTVLFLQPTPSFLEREQVIGRVDRIGQENAVRVVYSITPGTVEERLFQLSEAKEERADAVTQDAGLLRWIIKGDDHDKEAQHAAPRERQEPLWGEAEGAGATAGPGADG